MSLAVYSSAAFTNSSGLAVAAFADIVVRREDTGGLATIYEDAEGVTPIAQGTSPGFQADANGRFTFYAPGLEGGYKITVTSGANTYSLRNVGIGTAGQVDIEDLASSGTFIDRLLNPDGGICQRGFAATADDTYFADRWFILSQTNTVTPSALSLPEDGFPYGVRITQSQAVAQRFGFAQIVEGKNCIDMRGGTGTLAARIRISTSQAIRYAILGWTGTEDAVTSDVVNDWTDSNFTAGGFFNSTTLSVLATGSMTPGANEWTTLDDLVAELGSSFKNLIVMVWTQGTAAQNFTLDFDWVQLEKGSSSSDFARRPFTLELALCQRYYQKSFLQATTPAQNAGVGTGEPQAQVVLGSTNPWRVYQPLGVVMRAAPTVVTFNPAAANAQMRDQTGNLDGSSTGTANVTDHGIAFTATGNAGTGATSTIGVHWTAVAEL